eukprot:TRINITY_DN489_c0_g1_i9.p1 TRINITY_DN489_c0_g1~~TRINITY_DN489_c0_g1_i9.p1  ORF type:complete len:102 (-),score=1.55 TRINITY_DN489_c0_g1_i9:414-719(-)
MKSAFQQPALGQTTFHQWSMNHNFRQNRSSLEECFNIPSFLFHNVCVSDSFPMGTLRVQIQISCKSELKWSPLGLLKYLTLEMVEAMHASHPPTQMVRRVI